MKRTTLKEYMIAKESNDIKTMLRYERQIRALGNLLSRYRRDQLKLSKI